MGICLLTQQKDGLDPVSCHWLWSGIREGCTEGPRCPWALKNQLEIF